VTDRPASSVRRVQRHAAVNRPRDAPVDFVADLRSSTSSSRGRLMESRLLAIHELSSTVT